MSDMIRFCLIIIAVARTDWKNGTRTIYSNDKKIDNERSISINLILFFCKLNK